MCTRVMRSNEHVASPAKPTKKKIKFMLTWSRWAVCTLCRCGCTKSDRDGAKWVRPYAACSMSTWTRMPAG